MKQKAETSTRSRRAPTDPLGRRSRPHTRHACTCTRTHTHSRTRVPAHARTCTPTHVDLEGALGSVPTWELAQKPGRSPALGGGHHHCPRPEATVTAEAPGGPGAPTGLHCGQGAGGASVSKAGAALPSGPPPHRPGQEGPERALPRQASPAPRAALVPRPPDLPSPAALSLEACRVLRPSSPGPALQPGPSALPTPRALPGPPS